MKLKNLFCFCSFFCLFFMTPGLLMSVETAKLEDGLYAVFKIVSRSLVTYEGKEDIKATLGACRGAFQQMRVTPGIKKM